jgi:hypothetical protein
MTHHRKEKSATPAQAGRARLRRLGRWLPGLLALGGWAAGCEPQGGNPPPAPAEPSAAEAWTGNPEAPVRADNPYLAIAERNVTRSLKEPNGFWLAWGYAAPESRRRGDTELRELAMTHLDKACAGLQEKPENRWAVLPTLETIRLLQDQPSIPPERVSAWLAAVRPSVDYFLEQHRSHGRRPEVWTDEAPNIMHQTAAFLQLASELYEDPRYAQAAAELVRKSVAYQEDGGAFRYIRNSGPSQIYFGFDATFLGRYYQLSRDPVARAALVKMAGFSQDILANGLAESSSAPWWKHHWGAGGSFLGLEIVAGLSRDPLTRSVAEYRLGQKSDKGYFAYYSMYFWDPGIPIVPLGSDLCRHNTNIGGPQLRRGPWQVVMPGKPFGDTGIGCSFVTPGGEPLRPGFGGFLETAALPILGEGEKSAYGPQSFLVLAPEDAGNRASVVGDGWIASARSFQSRPPYHGSAVAPTAGGWQTVEIWYADDAGLGGWLTAAPVSGGEESAGRPRGYLGLGHPLEATSPTGATSGALVLNLHGEGVHWDVSGSLTTPPRKSMGPSAHGAWVSLPDGQPGYGLSVSPADAPPMTMQARQAGPVFEVLATGADGREARLFFNPGEIAQEVALETPEPVTVWRSGEPGQPAEERVGTLVLRPMEMAVIRRAAERE